MKTFTIAVWYRYVSHGEIEKDFDTHEIKASSVQDAVNKAATMYSSLKHIPYGFYFQNEKYKPNNFDIRLFMET